ncbi:MAG: hypothetical protein ACQEVA_00560 [Myxococcota bacterium]
MRDDSADGGDEDVDQDTQSNDTADDSGADATDEDTDGDTEMDATEDTTDDTTEDTSGSEFEGLACVVDEFTASCPDEFGEPNESTTTGYDLNDNNTIGCLNDEFRALSESHSTWLCANESNDWYDVTYYPCDNTTFRIEATFTPKTECDRELFEARLANSECSDPDVSCGWEGESYVIRKLVDTTSAGSSLKYYFGVGKITDALDDGEEVQLEYDVTFETRR